VFEKLKKEKKFHDWTWAALNLQPSDLRSNDIKLSSGKLHQHINLVHTQRKNHKCLMTAILLVFRKTAKNSELKVVAGLVIIESPSSSMEESD